LGVSRLRKQIYGESGGVVEDVVECAGGSAIRMFGGVSRFGSCAYLSCG
jgi:hypothetical protein